MQNLKDFAKGYLDSLKVLLTIPVIIQNSKILSNITNCILFNGFLFLGSAFLYTRFLAPVELETDSFSFKAFTFSVKVLYYSLIIVPIFLACNILSAFWIDEIYFESLKIYEKASSFKIQGQSTMNLITNQVERLFIVLSFVIQNQIISLIPISIISKSLLFFFLCILHSIYVFEYILLQKYIKDYISILFFVESQIYYFIGFGINFTIVIMYMDSFITSSAMFLLFFPLYLMASVNIAKSNFSNLKSIDESDSKSKLYFLFVIKYLYYTVFCKLLSFFVGRSNSVQNKGKRSSTQRSSISSMNSSQISQSN